MITISLYEPTIGYGSNTYLLNSDNSYAVVDPSISFEDFSRRTYIPSGALKYVILTHGHFDHIMEIDSWVKATGASVLVGEADRFMLRDPAQNCYSLFLGTSDGYFGEVKALSDGDVIRLGEDDIEVISLPGHTPGCIALVFDENMVVGDTVFASGYGRYDLPGGDLESLRYSIKRVLSYPDHFKVFPGHGPSSDIKSIKRYLYFD